MKNEEFSSAYFHLGNKTRIQNSKSVFNDILHSSFFTLHFQIEIFDILTHETVEWNSNKEKVLDFMRMNQDTAESMSCGEPWKRITAYQESRKGRMADALAHGGDEGRDKLR